MLSCDATPPNRQNRLRPDTRRPQPDRLALLVNVSWLTRLDLRRRGVRNGHVDLCLRLPWLNRSLFLILSIICSVLFTINMPQAQIKRAPASGPWDDRLGGVAGT